MRVVWEGKIHSKKKLTGDDRFSQRKMVDAMAVICGRAICTPILDSLFLWSTRL